MQDGLNATPQLAHPQTLVDPKTIRVRRDDRQRREASDDLELRESIKNIGIINPLVVHTAADGTLELIAGERRLREALALALQQVPITHYAALSEAERQLIELEENVKRRDLPWRDRVRATGRIHDLFTAQSAVESASWSVERTAERLGIHTATVYRALSICAALDSPKLEGATSAEHAYGILQRLADRRAEAIVSDIINSGERLYAPPPPIAPPSGYGNTAHSAAVSATERTQINAQSALDQIAPTRFAQAAAELGGPASAAQTSPSANSAAPATSPPILCANFLEWAPTYAGPRFNLIHCDFPYGVRIQGNLSREAGTRFGVTQTQVLMEGAEQYENDEGIFDDLLECLCTNLPRLMSHSAHLVFWFSMKFYTKTAQRLRATGLFVHDHPLVWHKTDSRGIAPGHHIYPKRTYDTALLCSTGNRSLVKQGANSYASPTVSDPLHPSQKPEPMLRFFLSMLVDETTTVLDPTCGSGSALRAAEDLGAKSILGLELNETFAADAIRATMRSRTLRVAGR